MDKKKKQRSTSTTPQEKADPSSVVPLEQHPQSSVGIDNRNESTRRYGELEPEGYSRHLHGNREGEFQAGGKGPVETPIEEGAPMKEVRYRKQRDKRAVRTDRFGGRTYNDLPGDHDIVDDILKKPPPPDR